jgi:hypothetical protein
LVVVGVAFAAYGVVDVVRSPPPRFLPKWAWMLICVGSIPLGGIVYFLVGRSER